MNAPRPPISVIGILNQPIKGVDRPAEKTEKRLLA
jgi:hypothetical protein